VEHSNTAKNLFEAGMWRVLKCRGLASSKRPNTSGALRDWAVKDVARALGVSSGRVYLIKHRVSLLVKREARRLERAL
jgi:hypothetical protein